MLQSVVGCSLIFSLEIQGKEKNKTPFFELYLGSPCLWDCCI